MLRSFHRLGRHHIRAFIALAVAGLQLRGHRVHHRQQHLASDRQIGHSRGSLPRRSNWLEAAHLPREDLLHVGYSYTRLPRVDGAPARPKGGRTRRGGTRSCSPRIPLIRL